jgi:hypothetical protein
VDLEMIRSPTHQKANEIRPSKWVESPPFPLELIAINARLMLLERLPKVTKVEIQQAVCSLGQLSFVQTAAQKVRDILHPDASAYVLKIDGGDG